MESVAASIDMTDVGYSTPKNKASKRKHRADGSTSAEKRSSLPDMVFYDGSRHPAGVLHERRPELRSDSYHFETEATAANQTRFRCTLTVDKDLPEPINVIGIGRSKQFAKNMAAQVKILPPSPPPFFVRHCSKR